MKRGFEDKLIIDGTSYNDQGEYVCEAVNLIAGRRNKVQSGPVKMEVRGKNKKFAMTLTLNEGYYMCL